MKGHGRCCDFICHHKMYCGVIAMGDAASFYETAETDHRRQAVFRVFPVLMACIEIGDCLVERRQR